MKTEEILEIVESSDFFSRGISGTTLIDYFNKIRMRYNQSRRAVKLNDAKNLQRLSLALNRILRARAKLWSSKGLKDLRNKILEYENKAADEDRSPNPYDSVFLEMLLEELEVIESIEKQS